MSHDLAIDRCSDEMIKVGMTTALGTYHYIGSPPITVRVSGNHLLCLTCQGLDRWADKERKGCVHCERIRRFVADHPEQGVAA